MSGDARRADTTRGQGKSEGTPQGRDEGNPTREQCDKAASNKPARKQGSVTRQSDPPVLKPRLTAILQKTHTSGPKLYPLSAVGQGHAGGPKDPPQPRLQSRCEHIHPETSPLLQILSNMPCFLAVIKFLHSSQFKIF